MKIYNGEKMILGRLASLAAKDALLGEEVVVVNCSKAIISGKKANTFKHEKERLDRKGYPLKSAKLSRLPEKFVRRSIRGMLPWKHSRGKEAFKRVMCYRNLPAEYEGKMMITDDRISVEKLPTLKYVSVGKVCKQIGGKEE